MKKAARSRFFHEQMSPITSARPHWREEYELQILIYKFHAKTIFHEKIVHLSLFLAKKQSPKALRQLIGRCGKKSAPDNPSHFHLFLSLPETFRTAFFTFYTGIAVPALEKMRGNGGNA